MSNQRLLSIKEAAAELGIHRTTASQIIRARGIPTLPLPYTGKGKGLDAAAMKSLRDALGKPACRKRQSATA